MVDLGDRGHRALAAAAAGALLDGHRRRDAEDRVHVGPRGRLHELPRVGVQRLEVAALALGEQDVEGERALAAAADAGDHGERVARDAHVDVLAGCARGRGGSRIASRRGGAPARVAGRGVGGRRATRRRRPSRSPRSAAPVWLRSQRADLRRRAGADDLAARLAALGPEVDDPVRGADHVEVVLDHDHRVARARAAARSARSSVAMSSKCRPVVGSSNRNSVPCRGCRPPRGLGQVAGQLQPLRLAAAQRRHRLAEPQVAEADGRAAARARASTSGRRRRTRRPRSRSCPARRRWIARRPSPRRAAACTSSTSAR